MPCEKNKRQNHPLQQQKNAKTDFLHTFDENVLHTERISV